MKKILGLFLCGLFLFTVTGCGGSDKAKKAEYTEAIKAVREKTTDSGNKYGDLLDKGLENSEWKEEESNVTVKGKDKESGEIIEITWSTEKQTDGKYKIKPIKYHRDGTSNLILGISRYLNKLENK